MVKKFNKTKCILIILTVYSLLSCLKLEYENYRPGWSQLASYHNEYKNGGSGKWRVSLWVKHNEPTRNFFSSLWFYGVPVYLTTIVSLILGISLHLKQNKTHHKIMIVFSIVNLGILLLLISQGVFCAAMKWGL